MGVDDIATLAVTHIHLDHAGGAGHFAQRYPNARIAVHPAGAPPPDRPIPAVVIGLPGVGRGPHDVAVGPHGADSRGSLAWSSTRATAFRLAEGRSIEVMATPGHAKHHVVFLEEETGGAFVGDAVGIAFPHGHLVQPVTPPPDFDPHLVTTQLRRMAARGPDFLGFAHFGPEPEAQRALVGGRSAALGLGAMGPGSRQGRPRRPHRRHADLGAGRVPGRGLLRGGHRPVRPQHLLAHAGQPASSTGWPTAARSG